MTNEKIQIALEGNSLVLSDLQDLANHLNKTNPLAAIAVRDMMKKAAEINMTLCEMNLIAGEK